ncbi:hypothetical protein Q7P36_008364 [Cladosporium allicinum]
MFGYSSPTMPAANALSALASFDLTAGGLLAWKSDRKESVLAASSHTLAPPAGARSSSWPVALRMHRSPSTLASPNEMRTQLATTVSIHIPKVGLSVGSE